MNAGPRSRNILPIGVAGAAVVLASAVLAIGLSRAPAAETPSPSPRVAVATVSPSASNPSAAPVASQPPPSVLPSAPIVTPVASWSRPIAVKGLENCSATVGTIDEAGTDHLAAVCGDTNNKIRYAVSTDGRVWTTTAFQPPATRLDLDPQLAIDGNTLYLAWTRDRQDDGGCGDDGLRDVGVDYRTRTLPSGTWSAPIRIGSVADHLQSFRVSRGVIHATVTNQAGSKTTYETVAAGTLKSYEIGAAARKSAVRVGDDGKARVAWEGPHGIEVGSVVGAKFSSVQIPNSSEGWDPALVLAPGNAAYLVFTRSYHGFGCAEPGPFATDGIYVATNANGTWVTKRLTKLVGGTSLALNPVTGAVDVLIASWFGGPGGPGGVLVRYHQVPGKAWTHETLLKGTTVSSPVIREDPTSGTLFAAFVANVNDKNTVEVMTRR